VTPTLVQRQSCHDIYLSQFAKTDKCKRLGCRGPHVSPPLTCRRDILIVCVEPVAALSQAEIKRLIASGRLA
jgi:hypothetical protein